MGAVVRTLEQSTAVVYVSLLLVLSVQVCSTCSRSCSLLHCVELQLAVLSEKMASSFVTLTLLLAMRML
jgi:uncharacterized BrkB/YihY/UPF0761 family membrane protein